MLNIFTSFRWQDLVDILIVYFIIHRAILLIRGTRAMQMVGGLVVVTVIYFIAREINLLTLLWLLRIVFSSILLITIIVFQHDIRRALIQVGKTPFRQVAEVAVGELDEIVKAAAYMSKRRIGALMVIERKTGLRDYVDSGHAIDANLTRELLVSIFLPSSPLHDGAVIISKGRIWTAGCLLPLSNNPFINKRYGTRHRAAIGLSEETDAVVIVVSEETQETSIVRQGALSTVHDEETLVEKLREIFIPKQQHWPAWRNWLKRSDKAAKA